MTYPRSLVVCLPYSNTVRLETSDGAGNTGGNLSVGLDRLSAANGMQYGNDSRWNLWIFTKDCTTGVSKVYLNGEIAGAVKTSLRFSRFNTDSTFGATQDQPFQVGEWPASTYWEGTFDELAIFDADLSPPDVNVSTGAIIPGVAAPRFLDMYRMGIN